MSTEAIPNNFEELESGRIRNREESHHKVREREKRIAEKIEEDGERFKEQAKHRSPKDVQWFIKKLHDDIGFFFNFFWDIGLSNKQHLMCDSFLQSGSHTIGLFGRQSGKTLGGAGSCCHKGIFGHHTSIGLYAPTQNQAINVGFGTLRNLIQSQPILEKQLSENLKSGYLKWNNGNDFRAHTANKDSKSIRGFSPTDIWEDETQDINDEVHGADIHASGGAVKGITVSGRGTEKRTSILETGTPKGRNHLFKAVRPIPIIHKAILRDAKIIKQGYITPSVWTETGTLVIWQPWWESKVQDLLFLEKRRRETSSRLFDQEYCCIFNTEEGYAFNFQHIMRAATIKTRKFKRLHHDKFAAGIDLGRNQDHTVLTIYRVDPETRMRFMVLQEQWDLGDEWRNIFIDCFDHLNQWQPQIVMIDKTGIGDPIYEEVFKRSRFNCVPFVYSQDRKNELMRNCEKLMEDNLIQTWDTEEFIWQMRDAPLRMSESGKPKYPKPDGGHDDRVQSNVLALEGSTRLIGDGDHRLATYVDPKAIEFRGFLDGHVQEITAGSESPRKRASKRSPRLRRGEWAEMFYQ